MATIGRLLINITLYMPYTQNSMYNYTFFIHVHVHSYNIYYATIIIYSLYTNAIVVQSQPAISLLQLCLLIQEKKTWLLQLIKDYTCTIEHYNNYYKTLLLLFKQF